MEKMARVRRRKETQPTLAVEEAPMTTSSKKRKSITEDLIQLTRMNATTGAAVEECCSSSGESPESCCSSNGSFGLHQNRIIKLSDLEVESVQAETSTCDCGDQTIRRKMSCSSEDRSNSPEVESVENKNKKKKKKKKLTMPSESELEEFFSAAEKDIQKRFQYKYNYDIVKDVPLEGRYEWVQIKP